MKKFLIILFLTLTLNTNAFADNMIVLKCKGIGEDVLAVIDLENKLFDINPLNEGIPYDFRFKITEANDKRIIAKTLDKEKDGDGYITFWREVTIDRYFGTIAPSGKLEIIKDTRTDKSERPLIFSKYFAEDCKKINPEKKF